MTPLALAVAAVGAVFGVLADRLATRWPEHDEENPAGRPIGWRTVVCAAFGALAFAILPMKFGGDQLALALFGAWFATLVVGMATDLDQRLLPDALTLPVIPVALVYALSGQNPLVGTDLLFTLIAAIAVPLVLYLPSIPFGAGAFGLGDVKLLIGVGLLTGASRLLGGVVFALLLAGVVLAVLLVTKRIGRQTYVPFGPFFILGTLWAVLIRP